MVSIHLSLTILSKSLCPQDTATHSLQFQPSNSFSYYIIFSWKTASYTVTEQLLRFVQGKHLEPYIISQIIYISSFFSVCQFYASYCASSMHMNSMVIYFGRFSLRKKQDKLAWRRRRLHDAGAKILQEHNSPFSSGMNMWILTDG